MLTAEQARKVTEDFYLTEVTDILMKVEEVAKLGKDTCIVRGVLSEPVIDILTNLGYDSDDTDNDDTEIFW